MSIHCPRCNFEILLTGVRPGRFSPKCQSCGQTFTLYVPFDADIEPMAARSHLELHEQCLRRGMPPPQPYPAGARSPEPVVTQRRPAPGPQEWVDEADVVAPEYPTVALVDDPPARRSSPVRFDEPPEPRLSRPRRSGWFRRRYGSPLQVLCGGPMRFVLGLLLFIGFAIWFQQNRAGPVAAATQRSEAEASSGSSPRIVEIPGVSAPVRRALSSWNACIAGAMLMLSALFRGRMLGVVVPLAALLVLIGHWFSLPNIGRPAEWISAAAGSAIGVAGMFLLRDTRA